jgi:hypothetical protein
MEEENGCRENFPLLLLDFTNSEPISVLTLLIQGLLAGV